MKLLLALLRVALLVGLIVIVNLVFSLGGAGGPAGSLR